jgi:ectoine hydroxylase-related dioxygenase (phytanoyl-CoA dioxygenase family)
MFSFLKRKPEGGVATDEPLWLDLPDAEARVEKLFRSAGAAYKNGLLDLIRTGFTVFPGAMDLGLCDQVVADYAKYLDDHRDYAEQWVDGRGRHNRLVNFHQTSEGAMRLGNAPFLMNFLDLVFGKRAGIYTSLTFEYGTEQPIHRDSPFFHTFPINYFVGAWVALEDIAPEAGPLMYVPGGHRFFIDHHAIYRTVRDANRERPKDELGEEALHQYDGAVIAESQRIAPPRLAQMRKGDLAVWHAALPHGGSPAEDPLRTRKSIVFHCAPTSMQVYQHDVFFAHEASTPPPPRYGFGKFLSNLRRERSALPNDPPSS